MDKLNAVLDKLNPNVLPASVSHQTKLVEYRRLTKEILQAVIDDRTKVKENIENEIKERTTDELLNWKGQIVINVENKAFICKQGDEQFRVSTRIDRLKAQLKIITDEIKELQAAMGRIEG